MIGDASNIQQKLREEQSDIVTSSLRTVHIPTHCLDPPTSGASVFRKAPSESSGTTFSTCLVLVISEFSEGGLTGLALHNKCMARTT